MPANRSRTERWRDCLADIAERGGGIEISIDRGQQSGDEPRADLVWRVRLLSMAERELVIERPTAINRPVELAPGTPLVGAMTIGQNRWMFSTKVLPSITPDARGMGPVRLAMPATMERCSRRSFYRVSTGGVELAPVEIWPLLDPASAVAAEVANEAQIHELQSNAAATSNRMEAPILPEVGPRFTGRLANLGGGGAGLLIERGEAGALDRYRTFWMRIDLRPEIPAPIGLTAKLAHTHLDSTGRIYAGVAFEFGFNQGHRGFVIEQITRYVNRLLNERSGDRLAA